MSNSTDVFWDVDGHSLQTLAFNITTLGGDRLAPAPFRGSDQIVPYRTGRKWTPRVVDSRTITLGMWVVGADEDGRVPEDRDARAEFDKNYRMLRKLLWTPRRQVTLTKRFRLPGDDKIYTAKAKAQYSSGLAPTMNGGARAVFTVDLLLSDPYFYGDEETITIDTQEPLVEFEVLGDDRTTAITAEITGFTKRLRVTNESGPEELWFEYARELPTGKKTLIDIDDFEVTHDVNGIAAPSSGSINHEGDEFWMFLDPGTAKLGISELDVPSRGAVWTNLATNPSFETAGPQVEVWRNLYANPSFERVIPGNKNFRTNLIKNPSFVVDSAEWSATAGATVSRVLTEAVAGTSSLRVVASGSASQQGVKYASTDTEQGKTYTFSTYVKAPAGLALVIGVDEYNDAYIRLSSKAFTATGSWQRVFVTHTASPLSTRAIPFIRTAGAVAQTFYIDCALLEKSSDVEDYFDGSSTDNSGIAYAWTGTANASTSTASATMVTVATNMAPNPSFETAVMPTPIFENSAINPSFEVDAAVKKNIVIDPQGDYAAGPYWFWKQGRAGMGDSDNGTPATYAYSGGPLPTAPRFFRMPAGSLPTEQNWEYVNMTHILNKGVMAGRSYTFSGYARVIAAGLTISANIVWLKVAANGYDYTTVGNSIGVPVAAPAGAWKQYSVVGTAPAEATVATVSLTLRPTSGTLTSALQYDASAFALVAGNSPSDPYDGTYFVGTRDPDPSLVATNLLPNASFEASTATVEVNKNWMLNPSFAARDSTKSEVYRNLVTNPSFETANQFPVTIRMNRVTNPRCAAATTNWAVIASGTTGSLSRVATGGPTNIPTFGRVTAGAAGGNGLSLNVNGAGTSGAAISESTSVFFSGYVRASGAGTAALRLMFYNAAGALISSSDSSIVALSTSWSRIMMSAVSPVNTRFVQASFMTSYAPALPAGATLDVTGSLLDSLSASAGAYFDGDSTDSADLNYSWAGTAHNSISTLTVSEVLNTSGYSSRPIQSTEWAAAGKSLRVYPETASNDSYVVPVTGLSSGKTYTIVATARLSAALTGSLHTDSRRIVLSFMNVSEVVGSARSAAAANVAGTTELRMTATIPSGFGEVRLYNGAAADGGEVWWDKIVVTEVPRLDAPYTGEYFDGASAASGDATFAWAGTANASESSAYRFLPANIVAVGAQAKPYLVDDASASRGKIWRNEIVSTAGVGINAVTTAPVGLSTVLMRVRSSRTISVRPRLWGMQSGADVQLPAGQWVVIRQNITTASAVGNTGLLLNPGAGHQVGDFLDVDYMLVTEYYYDGPFFDGATAAAGDFTYAWSGAANASASVQVANSVSGAAGLVTYATAVQSTAWANSGERSVRVIPAGRTFDTFVQIPHALLLAGKTYTILAKVRLAAPLTTTDARARRIAIGGQLGGTTMSPAVSNEAGVHEIRWTVTLTANASFFRLYNGSDKSEESVWWDDVTVIEGEYSGEPFSETSTPTLFASYAATGTWPSVKAVRTATGIVPVRENLVRDPNFAELPQWVSTAGDRVLDTGGRLKVTATGTSAVRLGVTHTFPESCPEGTYTMSVDLASTHATLTAARVYLYSTKTGEVVATGLFSSYAPNTASRRHSTTVTAPTQFDRIYLEYAGTAIAVGASGWFSKALLEKSPAVGAFFSGDTAEEADFSYAWKGTRNASSSYQLGTLAYGVSSPDSNGAAVLSRDWSSDRSRSLRVVPTNSGLTRAVVGGGFGGLRSGFVASGSYTAAVKIRLTKAQVGADAALARTISLISYNAAGVKSEIVSPPAPNVVGTAEIRFNFTVPAGSAMAYLALNSGSAAGDSDVWFDDLLIVKMVSPSRPYVMPYFDGASATGDDFSTEWTGVPELSSSTRIFESYAPADMTALNALSVSSKQWKSSGSRSLRLIPNSDASNDSFVALGGDTGALRLGMQAGKTYTAMATIRLAAAQTGSLNPTSRMLLIYTKVGASGYVTTPSNVAPNAPGVTQLRVTFQVPEGATEAFIRLRNGAGLGAGDVWFDDFLLIEHHVSTPYTGPYFDGDTSSGDDFYYSWAGTPHLSLTVKQGRSVQQMMPNYDSGSYVVQSSVWSQNGSKSFRVIPRNHASYAYFTTSSLGLVPGKTYTVLVTQRQDAAQTGSVQDGALNTEARQIQWRMGPERVVVATGPNEVGSRELRITFTYSETPGLMPLLVFMNGSSTQDIWYDNLLIVEGEYVGPYFDGGTANDATFTYEWTGAVDSTPSTMKALSVKGVGSSSSAVGLQSGDWAAGGDKSVWVYPKAKGSYVSVAAMPVTPGGTYTMMATVRLDKPQSTAVAGGRSIGARFTQGSEFIRSESTPNVAGVHLLRMTFTVPAGRTTMTPYLTNGDAPGGAQMWVDELLLVKTDGSPASYEGDYFDGNTPDTDYADYEWTGAPNDSTSIIRGVASAEPVIIKYRPVWL